MSGPRKIVDFDGTPQDRWAIDRNAVHLYKSKLWTHITTGCALCVEADRTDVMGQTLQSSEDEHVTVCLTHGPLDEIKYSIRRDVTITIGDQSRVGHQNIDDVILVPACLQGESRDALIAKLVEYVSVDEIQKGTMDDPEDD